MSNRKFDFDIQLLFHNLTQELEKLANALDLFACSFYDAIAAMSEPEQRAFFNQYTADTLRDFLQHFELSEHFEVCEILRELIEEKEFPINN